MSDFPDDNMPIEDILPSKIDGLFREVLSQRLKCKFREECTTNMFNNVSRVDFEPTTGEFSMYTDGVPLLTSRTIGEEKFQRAMSMMDDTENTETERENLRKRCIDNINDDMLMLYNAFKHKMMDVYNSLNIDPETVGCFNIRHTYASPKEDQVPFGAYLSGMGQNILDVMWIVIGSKLDEIQKNTIRPIFESVSKYPPALQVLMMIHKTIAEDRI